MKGNSKGRNDLHCKGCKEGLGHKHVSIENLAFCTCNDASFRLCTKKKDSSKCLCVQCHKNELLHGVSDYCGKNIDVVIKEINDKAYGGGHTCLKDCSLSEIQNIYKHAVIDSICSKEVHAVKFPITTYAKLNINSTCNVLGNFDACNGGGSFMSKEEMMHVSHMY